MERMNYVNDTQNVLHHFNLWHFVNQSCQLAMGRSGRTNHTYVYVRDIER